jgi:hypothetical protein
MIFFTGQCYGGRMLDLITSWGWRELRQPSNGPIKRVWGYGADNEAFRQFRGGGEYDPDAAVERLQRDEEEYGPASIAVVPDRVAEGMVSFRYSMWWAQVMAAVCDSPRYLAVQDGQGEDDVRAAVRDGIFGGIFVGGSTEWKWSTAARWVVVAHECGVPCHVGRSSSARRVRYCRAIGADSADSNVALSSFVHAHRFYRALAAPVYAQSPPTERITRTHVPVSRYSDRQMTMIEVLDVPVAT